MEKSKEQQIKKYAKKWNNKVQGKSLIDWKLQRTLWVNC